MEISLKVLDHFCNLAKVARTITEEAKYQELTIPEVYEISTSVMKELEDALQELGEEIFLDGIE